MADNIPGAEYSAGNDYYRLAITDDPEAPPSQARYEYWGGAGAPHRYQYFKDLDPTEGRNWSPINPGEHDEAASYFWAGVNTPEYVRALTAPATARGALEAARLANPSAIGQAVSRSESSLTGGNNEDDWRQELAFYGTPPTGMESYYTPEMRTAIQQQVAASSPAAQSARAGEDDTFGTLAKIAALAAAVYSGGAALGAWGGSGAGAISAADAAAAMGSGVDAAGWGSGALDVLGAEYVNTLGDWLIAPEYNPGSVMDAAMNPATGAEYVNTLGDWPIAPEYNPGSVMDAAMNPATGGSPQYASQDVVDLFDRAGTPGFDQYGNPSSFLDTLKGALRFIPGGALGSGNDLLGKILGGLTAYAQNQSAKTAAENNPAYKLPANYGNTLNPTNWAMLRRAEGGGIPGEPEEAGFAGYVQGADSGQSDGVHALLSPGEYVFDADTVSALGDGNNEAGAGILDQMRENIRRHKRSAPTDEIPPEALSPEQYLEGAE